MNKKPIAAVRTLAWAPVVLVVLIPAMANAGDWKPVERPVAEGSPEAVMALHGCGPHVTDGATGVVVDRRSTPTYLAGQVAVDKAYADHLSGTVHVYGFCR